MIGIANLPDGGHVLEHPGGPLYVGVKAGKITHAELAPWGEPLVVTWPPSPLPAVAAYWRRLLDTTGQGGDAAAQA